MTTRLRRIISLFALSAAGCTGALSGSSSDDGDDRGGTVRAATCPPPDLFEAALCVCEDFDDVGALSVVEGPSGIGAVGVNGFTRFVNLTRAAGDWIAFSGFEAVSDTEIAGSLMTEGDASWVGWLKIGLDLAIGGDVRGVGLLDVGGALSVGGDESLLGTANVGARAEYQPLDAPPCPCDPDTFFDVEAAVAAASTSNDNEAAGLPTRLAAVGVNDLRLETGSYYFEDAQTVGITTFTITGEVALFVDGAIDTVGVQTFAFEPGATLDLFVAGGVRTVGWLEAGGASDPAALRIYVGGEDSVVLSVGTQTFHGNIYAPEAHIAYVGDTTVVGSLFARQLDGVGLLEIGYGAPADLAPPSCEDPDGGGGGDDGGDSGQDDGVD